MPKMLELEKRIHLVARLPPPGVLAKAFNDFVAAKKSRGLPIEDFHVMRLLQTLKTINDLEKEEMTKGPHFTQEQLWDALTTLSDGSVNSLTPIHGDIVRLVHKKLVQVATKEATDLNFRAQLRRLSRVILVFSHIGATKEARNILEEFWKGEAASSISEVPYEPWRSVLFGFLREDDEIEFLKTIEIMRELSVPFKSSARLAVALFYAQRDRVEETKEWLDPEVFSQAHAQKVSQSPQPWIMRIPDAYKTLLEFCLRNNELEWGRGLLLASGNAEDPKVQTWNAIFQASAATGKGVEDIDRMISVMVRRKGEAVPQADPKPDISIFNGLLQYAISKKDSYYAERYSSLMTKWGAVPNAKTHMFQIQYRIMANDTEGALAAYNLLRDQPITANEDWDVMNELTQYLTRQPSTPHNHEQVMSLVADLSDRRALYPPATVAALSSYHLHRDEYFELVDLLQNFAYQYSISDRHNLLSILSSIALDPASDTTRVWDTYMVFHQVFDLECKRPLRNAIMAEMFRRGRPDLGTHVFTRMARHPRADTRPDAETYATALQGIADNAEPEALEVVHNMLKLDTDTEPDTRLRTALMIAYNAAQAPEKAYDLWMTIATSAEGPTYASLHAALRACERLPHGEVYARSIFERLQDADVEIGRDLVASYVGALAGNRMHEDAGDVVERVEEITRGAVDGGGEEMGFVLGTFFNAATGRDFQGAIEKWCSERYPEVWAGLVERGFDVDERGYRMLRGVDRRLTAE